MPIQILMPALSPTMTEGTLSTWLKKEGDTVESGDVMAEIETDKATMEIEAVDEGTLARILVPDGTEGVAVNAPIAILLEEGEDPSALDNFKVSSVAATPAAPVAAPALAALPAPTASTDRVFASPLARRIAAEKGVDLNAVKGTGPRGRIVKSDVEGAPSGAVPALAVASVAGPPPAPAAGAFTDVANSTMRKIIAARLTEAKQTIPHFYLSVDCRIDALLALRQDLNGRSPGGNGAYKISVNDFIIRATALALKQVPEANATWSDAAIRLYHDIDVAVAVATPNGLITPVVRHADAKGLAEISNEVKDLAARGKKGKLMPEEYQGGGFTISNLGMFGIKEFSAIINPPQSCILAVGAGEQRPVVTEGALAVATVMTCTLSVDHRSVDGAVGAKFLAAFKRLIEDPLTMML